MITWQTEGHATSMSRVSMPWSDAR